jgi:hypothetical protein
VTVIVEFAKYALAAGALALAWWTGVEGVTFALQFFRDGVLAAYLAALSAAGVAGVAGMAMKRWWGPPLVGIQAAGMFFWSLFFGRFPNTLFAVGLVAAMAVSVVLVLIAAFGSAPRQTDVE